MTPKSCFSCAVVLIFLGMFAIIPGVVYLAIDSAMHRVAVIFVSVGVALILLGIPVCTHSMHAMKEEKIEFMAQQTPGPAICGLLPGKPIAGNYLEQTQPLQQSDHQRSVGYCSQLGSHRPQSGSYRPESGSHNQQPRLYHQLPDQGYQRQQQHGRGPQQMAYASGELHPPSYSDVMYGPRGKIMS